MEGRMKTAALIMALLLGGSAYAQTRGTHLNDEQSKGFEKEVFAGLRARVEATTRYTIETAIIAELIVDQLLQRG